VKLRTELPDSDITVLAVTTDEEFPVLRCFHDGEVWRSEGAECMESGVIIGWLHLHEAAHVLKKLR